MKLLTVTVPCYNSEAYMRHCLDTLLTGGEDVEILIVDDGSTKDRTAEIADDYQRRFPHIVRAIHQENKGHGGAVNTGIDNATGLYFKVVDSDDWVDTEAFQKVLQTLREVTRGPQTLDCMLTNYVYEKAASRRKPVMRYRTPFPKNEIFTWDKLGPLGLTDYVLMHSMILRTGVLREVGLRLPEHTFYVDNLFAFIPFSGVKTLYYLDVNLYRYFIGRADQSVNEQVMIGRLDQQMKVNQIMLDFIPQMRKLHPKQRRFMVHYLSIIMSVTSIMLIRSKMPENFERKKKLWEDLKKKDRGIYLQIRWGLKGSTMNLPGKGGRSVSVFAYKIAQLLYGFN